MQDLLGHLLEQRIERSPGFSHLADLPLRDLAEVFYEDCAERNLQPNTIEFYHRNIDYLIAAAGDRVPAFFTADHLQLLLTYYRQTRHWSAGTVNHVVAAWHVFFSFLKGKHVIAESPMADVEKLREAQYLPQPYSDDEIYRMLAVRDDDFSDLRNYTMLLILLDTGIRRGELMRLTLHDLSLTDRRLRIFGKGRKERIVPISVPVAQALKDYLQARTPLARTDALWITEKGEPLPTDGFVAQFHRIARAANVSKAYVHRFRHTFATTYLRNGGNPLHLQHLLGHTTSTMTQRYTHLTDLDAMVDHEKASPVMRLLGRQRRE